jgi:uncharacterized membrane protein
MLTSFGLFWVGEGAGVHWPGSDLAIIALIGLFFLVTAGSIAWLRTVRPQGPELSLPSVSEHGQQ